MKFATYPPSLSLKPYVKTFVISEAEYASTYKVLPSTGLVIGFQYRGRLVQLTPNSEKLLSISGLTGIHDSYRLFKNSNNIGTVLVYFQEGGAAPFFRQSLHELFRESVSLDNFIMRSELLLVEEKLGAARTDMQKIQVVEHFLLTRLWPLPRDPLVSAALALIDKSKGLIRIKELAYQLHSSQSPLEKRFRQVVGTSPKKFASIVRLKHAIQSYHPQNSLTELGYAAGFYDQAHFIKEFKNFTGETPEDYFSSTRQ